MVSGCCPRHTWSAYRFRHDAIASYRNRFELSEPSTVVATCDGYFRVRIPEPGCNQRLGCDPPELSRLNDAFRDYRRTADGVSLRLPGFSALAPTVSAQVRIFRLTDIHESPRKRRPEALATARGKERTRPGPLRPLHVQRLPVDPQMAIPINHFRENCAVGRGFSSPPTRTPPTPIRRRACRGRRRGPGWPVGAG